MPILTELAPTAEALYERHLSKTTEWFPHEMVPYSRGRDFVPGDTWDPDEVPMPDAVRSALRVNLLTEDNLPFYFQVIHPHVRCRRHLGGSGTGDGPRRRDGTRSSSATT